MLRKTCKLNIKHKKATKTRIACTAGIQRVIRCSIRVVQQIRKKSKLTEFEAQTVSNFAVSICCWFAVGLRSAMSKLCNKLTFADFFAQLTARSFGGGITR